MIFLIIILSLFLFKNSFSIYFFQDDWFLFSISKIASLGDFLRFFIPRPDVQFYRPLSHEVFYLVGKGLFGLNPIGFHFIVWLVFIFNIFLVWKLSKKFISSKFLQLFFVFLYATSSIHYNSLYWIVNFSYILAGFWYFAGFLFFLSKNNSIRNNFWLTMLYVLGLLSNEFMIAFPFILIIYTLLFIRKRMRQFTPLFALSLFITCFYLLMRLFIFKPNYGTYQFVFDKSIISSYRWFFLFFLNWPETMKDQMLNWYRISPSFLATFSREFYIFAANLGLFALVVILIPIISVISNRKYSSVIIVNGRKIIFAIFWFLITLLPIILIPSHISPHQGSISFFGLLIFLIIILDSYKLSIQKYLYAFLILLIGISWVVSTYTTISLNDKIHWIKRRSDLAKYWIDKTRILNPYLLQNSILYIPTEEKEVIVALNDGRAFNEIYQQDKLKVIFKAAP